MRKAWSDAAKARVPQRESVSSLSEHSTLLTPSPLVPTHPPPAAALSTEKEQREITASAQLSIVPQYDRSESEKWQGRERERQGRDKGRFTKTRGKLNTHLEESWVGASARYPKGLAALSLVDLGAHHYFYSVCEMVEQAASKSSQQSP